MSALQFEATVYKIGSVMILPVPRSISATFPSRGMVLVKGTLNGAPFLTALEPDGKGSHWLDMSSVRLDTADITAGDTVSVSLETSKDWPEPAIPGDLQAALASDKEADQIWHDITPMARWDWIRWIRATNNPATRQHHVEVALSKMKHGTRRPCCFNRSMCTDYTVSKNGVLLDAA